MAEKSLPDDPNVQHLASGDVYYKGVLLLKNGQVKNPMAVGGVIASRYAYARFIEQEREIDALKREVQMLKTILSDFISRCELSSDGPEGAEAIARLKTLNKTKE